MQDDERCEDAAAARPGRPTGVARRGPRRAAGAARFARRNLPHLLLQGREIVLRRFRPILNAHGLTEQQWRVLRVLAERGSMEPRELVRACTLSSPSLTGILARMDDLGLIARGRVDGDQRRVLVSLTPRSRALAARVAPQIDAAYAALEAQLGADFTRALYDALDRLIDALDGDGDGVAAPAVADEAAG